MQWQGLRDSSTAARNGCAVNYQHKLYIEHAITHQILARIPAHSEWGEWWEIALDRYWLLQGMSKYESAKIYGDSNSHYPINIVCFDELKKSFKVGQIPKKIGILKRRVLLDPAENLLDIKELMSFE